MSAKCLLCGGDPSHVGRSIKDDPPPYGITVVGYNCETGAFMRTRRIKWANGKDWYDGWHAYQQTHWQELPSE